MSFIELLQDYIKQLIHLYANSFGMVEKIKRDTMYQNILNVGFNVPSLKNKQENRIKKYIPANQIEQLSTQSKSFYL